MTTPADAARRDLLQRYADRLAQVKWFQVLKSESKDFRAENKIGEGHPIDAALREIFAANEQRVMGVGSPAQCEEVERKVIG